MNRLMIRLLFFLLPLIPGAALQAQPEGLTGTLIVLNKGANNASFIDVASGDILATLPTGNDPHELAVTRDGRWAISSNYRGGNSLTVFDVASLSVARTIDLSAHPDPHGLLMMRNQDQVIVTTEGSNEILVVNFQTGEINTIMDTAQSGSHMVAIKEDGSLAITANTQSNSISVIELGESGGEVNVLDVPPRPEAITANWSATEVWVGSNVDGVVSVINPEDGEMIRQLTGFSWPYRILLTMDERFAIIPDARNETVRVFNADSGEETGSISLQGMGPQGVTLYNDDRTLFVSLSGADKVAVIDIETMEVLGEYDAGAGPDGIGYSTLKLPVLLPQ